MEAAWTLSLSTLLRFSLDDSAGWLVCADESIDQLRTRQPDGVPMSLPLAFGPHGPANHDVVHMRRAVVRAIVIRGGKGPAPRG